MKYENTVEVGSVVKSLDFPSTTDCYYVGLVTAILPDGTFRADEIQQSEMTFEEIEEYTRGWRENRAAGNFKKWE